MTEAVIEQPAAAPAVAAPAAPAVAAAPAAPSALAAAPPPLHERIPEKFHVKRAGEKGEEFDAEASMAKVLEGYQALEKRVGSGDLPPKTPEEYAVTVPEEMKETLKDFKLSPEFLKGAHEKGITQAQMDFMMQHYLKEAPALMAGGIQNSIEATRGNLEKAWGDKYDAEFNAAFKAFQAYASPEDKGKFDDIMRDPSLAYRILAKIGPELGEGGGVPRDTAGGSGEDIGELMRSEAYHNPKHADHAKVSAKVKAHYERKYGTAAVT
jgi:hypothetical protein